MAANEIAIETQGLVCRFGSFTAVDQISLRIPRGVIYGFLGPNGSGKSTTIRMLCGILSPTAGSGYVLGYDICREAEAIKQKIGYMSQKFSLYADLTVRENLEFYAGLYSLSGINKKQRIQAMLEMANLTQAQLVLAGELAGGVKQRLALGCALLHQPEIVFLDEPTSGVDPVSRRLFWEILYALAERGTTILVTTHFMDEAEHCDEVGFIYQGKLKASGTPAALKRKIPGRLFEVKPADSLEALLLLQSSGVVYEDAYIFGKYLHVRLRGDDAAALARLGSCREIAPTMEDVFVHHVKENKGGEAL